jgi:hypothetical protein
MNGRLRRLRVLALASGLGLIGVLVMAAAPAGAAVTGAAAVMPHSGPASAIGAAPDDTPHGQGALWDEGNGGYGYVSGQGGGLEFNKSGPESIFTNLGIPINGQFQIEAVGNGCLAIATNGSVGEDTHANCAAYGGEGAIWDRWNAINEGMYDGDQVWELKNADGGKCLYDDKQSPAVVTTCIATDHFEWFAWPGSNL